MLREIVKFANLCKLWFSVHLRNVFMKVINLGTVLVFVIYGIGILFGVRTVHWYVLSGINQKNKKYLIRPIILVSMHHIDHYLRSRCSWWWFSSICKPSPVEMFRFASMLANCEVHGDYGQQWNILFEIFKSDSDVFFYSCMIWVSNCSSFVSSKLC